MIDPINISLMEQYIYCPKQAQNQLCGVKIANTAMLDGTDAHEYRHKIRCSWTKSRNASGHNKKSYATIKQTIQARIKNNDPTYFTEVKVESKELGVNGLIDEVRIGNNCVLITDYKTTFRKSGSGEYVSPSHVCQIRAYAAAFREHYGYKGRIYISIKKVYLVFDWASTDRIDENEEVKFKPDMKFIVSDGWEGHIKEVYNTRYHPDTDIDDIKKIVAKIRSKDFKHEGNKNKCDYCQYNISCDDSLIEKERR